MDRVMMRAQPRPTLAGLYELDSEGRRRLGMLLDVHLNGNKATFGLTTDAAHRSDGGPKGEGVGTVSKDGVLRFTYSDNFGNTGEGTFKPADPKHKSYELSIHIVHLMDSRSLLYYGESVKFLPVEAK